MIVHHQKLTYQIFGNISTIEAVKLLQLIKSEQPIDDGK